VRRRPAVQFAPCSKSRDGGHPTILSQSQETSAEEKSDLGLEREPLWLTRTR
jgi:hypothetical protein